jgi:hypothetical protein
MGNLLQYTNKNVTIDNKLNSLMSQINYDYNNGNIRTETEYYYRIKNMLSDFYDSLTKPTFKYRPAVSTPMSDEYNSMITESCSDMEYIIKDCEALNELVSQSFTNAELSRTMMTNELAYISKKITAIGESIAKNQPQGTVVFTELFNDLEAVGNSNSSNACHVNTSNGILTLKHNSKATINIKKIEIDNEVSNGFPGNTHCVDTLNNELHFIGQNGLNIKPEKMIDNTKDSWFEFELFSISDEVRKQCNSYGFEYDEGVSWVNNEDPLRLKLIVHLASNTIGSWATITPYLSDVKGVKSCYLEKCEVITSSNNVYEVAKNKVFDDTLVFPFPPQEISRIEFTFVQPYKYLTKVGHFYYTAADTSNMSIFQNYDYSDEFARVDGDKPSVGLLNVKYNPTTKWITYPDSSTEILDATYVKDKLFTLPESTIARKANQEIIDAYRYMIGIREINLSSNTFMDYGEYVSNKFITDEAITSISLEADEYIPGNNAEILRYYISLNGGNTWHKIYPIHRAYQGIYKYYVNNDSIENLLTDDSTQKKSKNLSIMGETKSIQIKIEMDRPTNLEHAEYCTPIVYGYKLKLTTGGETIEY